MTSAIASRQDETEQSLRRRIELRTGGRIRALQLQASAERVVVRGRTSSYYLKQLVLEAVRDVLGNRSMTIICLEIHVSGDNES
jgi:hypothetical protein